MVFMKSVAPGTRYRTAESASTSVLHETTAYRADISEVRGFDITTLPDCADVTRAKPLIINNTETPSNPVINQRRFAILWFELRGNI